MSVHFLVPQGGAGRIGEFLEHWAPDALRRRFRVLHYGDLHRMRRAPGGAWIFSSIDRLAPAERRVAAALERRLRAAPATHRVLNSPTRSLTRVPLLRLLHERGENSFGAHLAAEPLPAFRYPVFVRVADNHRGSCTPPLADEEALRAALDALGWKRQRGRRVPLVVSEFCETAAPDGLYRKYSLMRVGAAVVPRHVLFSRNWVTKFPDVVDPDLAAEEARFVDAGARTPDPSAAFGLAAIDYGRIDYGVLDGRAQVWEINTNPRVVPHPGDTHELRRESQRRSADLVIAAFEALDADLEAGPDLRVLGLRDVVATGAFAAARAAAWIREGRRRRRRAARKRRARTASAPDRDAGDAETPS